MTKESYTNWLILCAIALLFAMLIGRTVAEHTVAAAPSLNYTLDAPRTLLGPSSQIDNAAHTFSQYLYAANVQTYAYNRTTLASVGTVLSPGTAFDNCGAWLNSAYQDGSVVRGWYHAESVPQGVSCAAQKHRMSVAYAESTDGGRTFQKPNYPNNQVLTGSDVYSPTAITGVGQQYVRLGSDGFYYMAYQVPANAWQVHEARAPVSSGGGPGTWLKWDGADFTQPGIGGSSVRVALGTVLGLSWIEYSTELPGLVGFSWSSQGYGLATTTDNKGVSGWRVVIPQLLTTSHNWGNRTNEASPLIDYPSLLGADMASGSALTDTMQLAYMFVPPNQNAGANRELRVQTLHLLDSTPTATQTPTVTPTASRTATPVSTATPTAVNTQTPSETPTATATATSTATPSLTATTTPTCTPTLTPSQTATATPTATQTPTPTPQGTPCRAWLLGNSLTWACP